MLDAARAELAALREANARMREALAYAMEHMQLGRPDLVERDLSEGLSTPAPAGVFVTLEQLREIEWRWHPTVNGEFLRCPFCGRWKDRPSRQDNGHAPDCWLAAAIRDAGVDGEARL